MEVHFKPDVQAKLEQMARESGRPSDELVEDACDRVVATLTKWHTRVRCSIGALTIWKAAR